MHFTITNKEDSIKVDSLKYDGGLRQETLYGVNVIEPKPIPGGYAKIREESPMILTQECLAKPSSEFYSYYCIESSEVHLFDVHFLYRGKKPIFLDQENLDYEEKVDYDPDAYLTEPDDMGFEGGVGGSSYMPANDEPRLETMGGAAPTSILASGEFEPFADFDGTYSILESDVTVDIAFSPALTPISAAQC
ncbi:uncharacterized protein A4U43_C07F20770 [Asparagus officinalis]|uniref:Uncharacterized protein n=1 Tax=Asparagus officinalis TaxID=4686 RepID=A0A5P1EGK9_ASPOF|nr:uncharacterized protein A4U43_C07F20770 [Asparagus officinalis]